jgi:Ni,Fe-hydrogenase I cytochrome b subunit
MRRLCQGKALGGELGVRAVHEIFSFWLYLVFWVDRVYVIVHPGTVKNEEAIRRIRSSKYR